MDAEASEASPSVPFHNITDQTLSLITPMQPSLQCCQRHCFGNTHPGEFPLATKPSIVLHVLTSYDMDPEDLAHLETTCKFFRQPANFLPDLELPISELAALDMCQKRAVFKPMTMEEREMFKQRCGGSWKLVLRYLLAGETCCRREKSQAIAGPGYSIVVTANGAVYTFGSNMSGQLGHRNLGEEWRPRVIKSLEGIRIIQAAAGFGRTMLISDAGRVYALGEDSCGEAEFVVLVSKIFSKPRLVESLKGIYIVQAAIGHLFTAVLSREGKVYTFSCGNDVKLGHQTEPNDVEPHLLRGALENTLVVQISAGFSFLLALACQPSGMSVYSVGCGLGEKLGHGSRTDEGYPRLIEEFQALNLQPMVVSAGAWHAAVVGRDGRVCTWGWGRYGCLGHGNEYCEPVPKVVEALSKVKAVYVATGSDTTFVLSEEGDVYSFGCGKSASLGHTRNIDAQGATTYFSCADQKGLHYDILRTLNDYNIQENRHTNVYIPKLVTSLKNINERIVQISITNSVYWNAHTFALTESNKLYAFGAGNMGQLGIELADRQNERGVPELVELDLS